MSASGKPATSAVPAAGDRGDTTVPSNLRAEEGSRREVLSGKKRTFTQASESEPTAGKNPDPSAQSVLKRKTSHSNSSTSTPVLPAGFFDDEEEGISASAQLLSSSNAVTDDEQQAALESSTTQLGADQKSPMVYVASARPSPVVLLRAPLFHCFWLFGLEFLRNDLAELEKILLQGEADQQKERALARKELKSVRKIEGREQERFVPLFGISCLMVDRPLIDPVRLIHLFVISSHVGVAFPFFFPAFCGNRQFSNKLEALKHRMKLFSQRIKANAQTSPLEDDSDEDIEIPSDYEGDPDDYIEQVFAQRRQALASKNTPAAPPSNVAVPAAQADDQGELDEWRGKSLY